MFVFPVKSISKDQLRLGSAIYSSIWEACKDEDCLYLLKKSNSPLETLFQKEIFQLGLSMEVIDSWQYKDNFFILMPKVDTTTYDLFTYSETIEDLMEILMKCMGLLYRLHTKGYVHGDPHLKNIAVVDNSYYFINFEKSKNYPSEEDKKMDYLVLIKSIEELSRRDENFYSIVKIAHAYYTKI